MQTPVLGFVLSDRPNPHYLVVPASTLVADLVPLFAVLLTQDPFVPFTLMGADSGVVYDIYSHRHIRSLLVNNRIPAVLNYLDDSSPYLPSPTFNPHQPMGTGAVHYLR